MRKLYTLLFLLLVYSSTQAQVLQTTNLNLNAGGVIHDVAYDSYYDAYIVVGDFSSIGGQNRTNLAFVDANTLGVMSFAPVSSIDGPIRSVEVVNFVPHSGAPGAGFRNYIYLGGNFTTINTQTKTAIARLFSTHYYSQPPAGGLANYSVQAGWDAQFLWTIAYGSEFGVHDFHLMGDTLIAVGEFTNVGASYLTGNQNNKVISIDANHPTFQVKNLNFLNGAVAFGTNGTEPLQGVAQLDNRLFLYGEDLNFELINEYQLDGTFVQQIEYCNPNNATVLDFEPHPTSVDTMLFAFEGSAYSASTYYITSYLKGGSLWNCPGVSLSNYLLDFPTMGQVNYIETYKDFVFTAGSNTNSLFVSKRNGTANVPILNSIALNSNWFSTYPNISYAPCLEVRNNLLFFSADALNSVDGQTRTGLAVFCLEPTAAEPFTQSDPTACEGDSSVYTIPQAQCADGYRWTYSGTGALYRITGSGNPWAALSSIDLIGSNTNSIEIIYPLGATSGTLSVEPFTIFSAVDNHYSQGQSVAITVNQKPDIILPSTYALNCYSDSTLLVAQTNNPNPQFLWTFNSFSDSLANDSLLITINDVPLFDSMYYYMQITDALTGCFDIDSTFFTQDLVADSINLNLVSTNPTEWNCLTDSMVVSSGQTGFIITWQDQANLNDTLPNPFTIYSAPTSNYYIHGTQISNGCSTQKEYGGIVVNTDAADPVLVGHPNFLTDFPDDSLSCLSPSLTLQCDVDPVYSGVASAQWSYNGTPLGSDILNLTTADSAGMDGLNVKYYWIVTTHSTSQCADSTQITIRFDYDKPLITQLPDQSINCSQSEITLTHPINGSANVIEGWLDATGTQTGVDTIVASSIGDYHYQVTSNANGCSSIDTVSVGQSLDLLLNMPTDTTICPNQVVTIAPSVIGNTETPTYLWSTGSTNSTQTATGGTDSLLTVTISTPSGCSGTDSTNISINSPVDVTVTPYIACSDGSLEITDISGGAGNYQYSIDGTTWQDSTNFPSLAFGTYSIFVQDDLGCIYDTTQTLDGTASTVEMNFVVSTYNEEGDTIALVNITDFTGLDSVSWTLPTNANVTFEDDSIVILSMDVAGWYDIELTGYIGSDCEYSFTKPVYFGDHAPIFNDSIVFNGIDSLVIYPNPLHVSLGNDMITVYVEFGKSQNYTILVTNNLGQPIPSMSVSGVGEIVSHQLTFPTGTSTGAYRVHVIADYDAKHEMITLD